MIYIVGDEPSKSNKSIDVPFVGTKSYKRLLDWIYKADLDINQIVLCNRDQIYMYGGRFHAVDVSEGTYEIESCDVFVALGVKAESHLTSFGLKCLRMPHPSGRNRQLNDEAFEALKIKELKEYCNGKK